MRGAAKTLILLLGAAAIAACQKQAAQNEASNEISMEDNLPQGEIPSNAQIETLPADESSTTPSNQLQNGFDNPDVNDLGNSD
jgi:hypothetical protein